MKKMIKNICFATVCTFVLSGCLEETFPTGGATADQIANEGVKGLSNAIMAYMTNVSSSDPSCIGYPGMMLKRDAMTADLPILKPDYDYFSSFGKCTNLGASKAHVNSIWSFYYYLIQKTNLLIGLADEENEEEAVYLGNAYAYRALAYFDLARLYEFKHTGISELDAKAPYKVTVPIVTEETDERAARNNPRAPFYKMYRFIAHDLNAAERLLANTRQVTSKAQASIGTVYGLKARFWLELGSRFERYPEDLAEQISKEAEAELACFDKLGIANVSDCFHLAAEYARKAINLDYSPVVETQWFDKRTGFNTVNNAWMWAIVLSADDDAVKDEYYSFISFMSPEATYGFAYYNLGASRMIDADLFAQISEDDWRKTTWIDPADFNAKNSEEIFEAKYAAGTILPYQEWKRLAAYVGLKFHPGQGERDISTTGNLISIPLMRIEEMYFIEAEAIAYTRGVAEGKRLLETFINENRYKNNTYVCDGTDMDSFIRDLFIQKRIEFWGEGILMWDYKRLEYAVTKNYAGTNHPVNYRLNSLQGYVAPWMNIYIPTAETQRNFAVVDNPDPSGSIKEVK